METTDDAVLDRFPTVSVDADNIEFYRGLLRSQFLINQCQDCHKWHHPPLPFCPRCWSDRLLPTEIAGDARVFMSTVLYLGPLPEEVDYTNGYTLITVELAEQGGLRVSGPLIRQRDSQVEVGMHVHLVWIERNGHPVPAFEPVNP